MTCGVDEGLSLVVSSFVEEPDSENLEVIDINEERSHGLQGGSSLLLGLERVMLRRMVLYTERLALSSFEERDRDVFHALHSNPEVMQHLGDPLSREQSDALMNRFAAGIAAQGWGYWAVELKETKQFIGIVGLSRPQFEAPFMPCLEVGWRLDRRYWGFGYATEAARFSIHFAFTSLRVDEVVSFTAIANDRSCKVMKRVGMQRDEKGDFDHPKLAVGDPRRRHVLYRLTRELWLSRRGGDLLVDGNDLRGDHDKVPI